MCVMYEFKGENVVTRSELVQKLSAKYPHCSVTEIEKSVKKILEHITDTLGKGGRIEIRGFGSFSVRYREPKIGRNPKTGDAVKLNGKYTTHFKPGKLLRERVNESRKQYPLHK